MVEDLQRFRFVVRMPNWLGDAVMATPILHDLKTHFPNCTITSLASHPIQELLRENPYIDETLSFSRKAAEKSKESERILQELKNQQFDAGILLTGSFSSAWQFFRAKLKMRVGFACHFRTLLLTHPVPKAEETVHLVTSYKKLLQPLDIPISHTAPALFLSDHEKRRADEILASYTIPKQRRLIGINPGAAYGSAKCWPPENFKALTNKLLEDPAAHILYFGDPGTKPLVDMITEKFPERVTNLAGKTSLRELIALINACSLFITNDSGPMHIAAALKRPLVAIFGSTNEIKTGPYGSMDHVIHKHVPCSPCYLRKCPIDFRCMRSITVENVVDEVMAI